MKIIQIVPSLNYGDAIGNDVLALNSTLRANGYDSLIYADGIDKRIQNNNTKEIKKWEEPEKDDVIIYHLATGWSHIDLIKKSECRKIVIFHNITPPEFYKKYDFLAYKSCCRGIEDARMLNQTFDYCLAVSDFNKKDLLSYGYSCKIDILPIVIPFEDYRKEPDEETINTWKNEEGTNILFVGRIVPNKKIEDVISCFYYYKKYFDKKARLFLVGSHSEEDLYFKRLRKFAEKAHIKDIHFFGQVTFKQILAFYNLADLFLCMSEHEGFCVPLIESMLFDKPIVAYKSTAIPYTLGDSGVIVDEKNYLEIASLMNYILKNDDINKNIIDSQRERLKFFDDTKVKNQFIKYLNDFVNCE